jgi:hypothetical protein
MHYPMKAYVEWMHRSTFSWPWHLPDVSGQLQVLAPGTHWMGGCVGPSVGSGWRGEEKILDPTGTRNPTPNCVQQKSSWGKEISWEIQVLFSSEKKMLHFLPPRRTPILIDVTVDSCNDGTFQAGRLAPMVKDANFETTDTTRHVATNPFAHLLKQQHYRKI